MDYHSYESAGQWFIDARKNGFIPSCSMMHGITQTMKKLGMTFPKTFEFLEKTKKILLLDKMYYFNLDYEKLFKLSKTERSLLLHIWQIIDYIQVLEEKKTKIFWNIKSTNLFDFIKSELSKECLTENIEEASIVVTHGTQYGISEFDTGLNISNPKYAIVLGFSAHSHVIAERGSLYALKDRGYRRIPSMPMPNKQWAEYYAKVTGKPESETWLQGMFFLTEIEGFSQEEAQKFMKKNWWEKK